MTLQDILNSSEEVQEVLTVLKKKSMEPLTSVQTSELSNWLDRFGFTIEHPVYRDYIRFKNYAEQLDKCRNCDGSNLQCSSKSLRTFTDGGYEIIASSCPVRACRNIIKAAQVPAKFRSSRLNEFVEKKGLDAANFYDVVYGSESAYFFGVPGVGKTWLSSVIINERAHDNRRSHFYTVTDLVADLQDFENPRNREEKLIKLHTTPCLVIDDLGAEHASNWVATTLFSIIDTRYKDNLKTIINSNFSVDELCERYPDFYGDRISRRIKSMCTLFHLH